MTEQLSTAIVAAEAKLAASEAECERLRVQEQNAGKLAVHHLERAMDAESRLAAANALLARIGVWADTYGSALKPGAGMADSFGDGVRACKGQVKAMLGAAHLADQAPPRTEAEPRGHHCGLSGRRPDLGDEPCPACERGKAAYLARRGLKP